MAMDQVGKAVMKDPIMVDFVNYLGITLHDEEDLPSIRVKKASIRRLGRFLTTAQTINESLSFETLLDNTQFELLVDIVKKVPVQEGTSCRTRSLIGFDLKNLIKRQLEKLRMLPSGDQRDLKLKSLELLSHNMGEPWTIRVNSQVHHNIAEIGRNQRQELVKCEDVTKVFNYATSQMKKLLSVFEAEKTSTTYRNLLEIVYTWICLFNYR